MKTVIITGVAGFLGSHLAEFYLKSGFAVVGLDNFCTGMKSNVALLQKLSQNFHFIEHDVTESWPEAGKGQNFQVKYVFHLASPASPEHYQRLSLETIWANTVGLRNCLELADELNARVIFASTSEVYGDPAVSPQSETYWGNVNSFGERSCYDEAKRCGEALIFSHNKRNKTGHGLVRIFNTYGPRMNANDGRVVINFILQAIENSELTIYGDGSQSRSFCYVGDLIKGLVLYAESDLQTPVNLGMDQEYSINELAKLIIKITKSASGVKHLPLPADDPKKRRPDLKLARLHLPAWNPEISLEEGLTLMRDWLSARP